MCYISILYCMLHLLREYITMRQLGHSMFCLWKCFQLTSQCDHFSINVTQCDKFAISVSINFPMSQYYNFNFLYLISIFFKCYISILYCMLHLLREYITMRHLHHSIFCLWKCFQLTSQCLIYIYIF